MDSCAVASEWELTAMAEKGIHEQKEMDKCRAIFFPLLAANVKAL